VKKPPISNLALVLISTLLVLGLAELIARTLAPPLALNRHYVWPPNLDTTFTPTPEIMPGVSGPAHFVTNNRGIRGDDLADDQHYRILAVGGSTTECVYLDTQEAWPRLVQEMLAEQSGKAIWVGNTGKSGQTTYGHIEVVRHLLAELPRIDMVLLLTGINDLSFNLGSGRGFEEPTNMFASNAFFGRIEADPPFYQRTGLWNLLSRALSREDEPRRKRLANDLEGANYALWRQWRAQARDIITEMPNLGPALDAYEQNLNAIVDLAQQRSVRVVLMTQPVLWRPDLSPEERALLWFGWIGPRDGDPSLTFYDVEVLASAMDQFNARVLKVCQDRQIECIDLDQQIPRSTASFYDDVHFNEAGSRLVAETVARYLAGTPPFNQWKP